MPKLGSPCRRLLVFKALQIFAEEAISPPRAGPWPAGTGVGDQGWGVALFCFFAPFLGEIVHDLVLFLIPA
jgi:hypothetical protein